MAVTVLFDVIDAVLAQLPTVVRSDVLVTDCYPPEDYLGDFVAVGVEDPVSPDRADSADAQMDWAHASGRSVDEVGSVRCVIGAYDGDTIAAARDRVKVTLDAIDTHIRDQVPPIGLPRLVACRIGAVRLYQQAADFGFVALLAFSLDYRARI